jgi:hypothetical protein
LWSATNIGTTLFLNSQRKNQRFHRCLLKLFYTL